MRTFLAAFAVLVAIASGCAPAENGASPAREVDTALMRIGTDAHQCRVYFAGGRSAVFTGCATRSDGDEDGEGCEEGTHPSSIGARLIYM